MLLGVTVGSIVLGLVLSRVLMAVNTRIHDVPTAVIVQFCTTFAVWILAERLHLSGILTMVVFAIAVARRSAEATPARIRIPSYAVWEVAVFVLNVLAFILIGFQLKSILARIDGGTLAGYVGVALAVCAATILARIAWVTGVAAVSRWYCRPAADGTAGPKDAVALSPHAAALVGWCGMRGIVTLAAALALPTGADGAMPFPHRDLILFTAFSVVLVTLVVQGVTLRPLLGRLQIQDDGAVEREVRLARVETLRAGLAMTAATPDAEMTMFVRRRYALKLKRAEAELHGTPTGQGNGQGDGSAPEPPPSPDAHVVFAATMAERQRLVALRAQGTIGDAAFQRVEQELDWSELDLQQMLGAGDARE
jgi:CPA1 family monovalent cation:H+ antiporter